MIKTLATLLTLAAVAGCENANYTAVIETHHRRPVIVEQPAPIVVAPATVIVTHPAPPPVVITRPAPRPVVIIDREPAHRPAAVVIERRPQPRPVVIDHRDRPDRPERPERPNRPDDRRPRP